ncbi:MAG: helix-turn-helix transcriptional regulator [Firmicutes bacterium]|nr:helix-turn-helix transcriptional regulator [Bacillota bacterium]
MPQYYHETHIMDDELMPFIFHTDTINPAQPTTANWHENIELLCCLSGEGTLRCGTETFPICKGSIMVIAPNIIHLITSETTVVYHCLIVENRFCEANGIPVSGLHFPHLVQDPALYDFFLKTADILLAKDQPYQAADARSHILSLLVQLCRCYASSTDSTHTPHDRMAAERIKTVLSYIRQHLAQPMTLEQLAQSINLSKYHFSREFKLYTGQSVFDYINLVRCQQAQRLLYDGATVREAAEECGYENLSYFSRTFRRYMGVLPSVYLKK